MSWLATGGLGGGLIATGGLADGDGAAPVTLITGVCPAIGGSLEVRPSIAGSSDAGLRPRIAGSIELLPRIADIVEDC